MAASGDYFDEEEQEGDEDMHPIQSNLGEQNFTTDWQFNEDNLAPGSPSNNTPAAFSQNDWPDDTSRENLFGEHDPPSTTPSETATPTSQPTHPPQIDGLDGSFRN